jgi:(1->4)-alpha-D-glucan 1-alpha-D-glucosylmutase
LILRLYAQGWIDGVRIDHVDGLAEPREYCQRLRARLEQAHMQRAPALREHPPYLVIEKILARGEAMRTDWKVDGTTGYDFLNDVGALLHDPDGAAPLANLWAEWSGRSPVFEDEALAARHKILEENLSAERDRCARALHRLARDDFATRDFTFTSIRRVLTALVVHFPVYRIYPQDNHRSAEDQKYFGKALAGARGSLERADHPLLAQMDRWLGGEEDDDGTVGQVSATPETAGVAKHGERPIQRDPRVGQRRMALTLFSQLTSPAAAKSVEDTACYRYGRLISRNEVGADPDDFALPVEDFHVINTDRARHFPHAMLTTATHDHKRGEDVRARIAVLSEIPLAWGAALRRWSEHNHRAGRVDADTNTQAPGAGFESMLYQTLIGCWPPTLRIDDTDGVKELAERVSRWQEKALREAKLETDWSAPNEAYETASRDFLFAILSPEQRGGFLKWLHSFVDAIAPAAVINALQQTLLRLTAPGIPDTYQGTDLWDMSLVDPDNRRPVDYLQHARFLASLDTTPDNSTSAPGALLKHWHDGRIKQLLVHRALVLRKRLPALFLDGGYTPLTVLGSQSRSVLAFARQHGDDWVVVVVTRLAARLLDVDQAIVRGEDAQTSPAALPLVPPARWEDTTVVLPEALRDTPLFDHLSGRLRAIAPADGGVAWALADLLDQLPVALLSTATA